MQKKYSVTPEMEHLVFFNHVVRKLGQNMSAADTYNTLLILEEAYSNIVKYGELKENDTITVGFKKTKTHFILEFTDSGKAFNPLEQPMPDLKKNNERQKGGGFGIFLYKLLTDKVTYKRENEKNQLMLRIPIEK